jgi:hypothetical protein
LLPIEMWHTMLGSYRAYELVSQHPDL